MAEPQNPKKTQPAESITNFETNFETVSFVSKVGYRGHWGGGGGGRALFDQDSRVSISCVVLAFQRGFVMEMACVQVWFTTPATSEPVGVMRLSH